jgi:HEAT repeat protein
MILDFREGRFMQAKSWDRGRCLFQVSVARLMVLVAVAAVLCVAWMYHREYSTTERSWVSMHLRDLHHDETVQRRWAAENLDRAEADDVARVVSGLAGAMGDPDWQVRRAAARSLAGVIRSCAANHKRALIDEINLAMRALVPALDDSRTEVRIAAMESVGKLGDTCLAFPVAMGRSATRSVVVPEAKQIASALLRAMRDPSAHVRAKAVWSLAYIGPPAEIDPAPIKEAVENDPAIEVRSAAMGALFTGWPVYSRNKDALGR